MVEAREKRFYWHQLESAFELVLWYDLPCPSQHRYPPRVVQPLDYQNLPPSEASRLSLQCRSSHLQLKLNGRGHQLNCCSLFDFCYRRPTRNRHSAFLSRRSKNYVHPLAASVRLSLQSLS